MPIPIFQIFMVFGIVSVWSAKALEDGKISLDEAADLGEQLGRALGIPTELKIPTLPPKPGPLVEEVKEEQNTEASETTEKAAALPAWAK